MRRSRWQTHIVVRSLLYRKGRSLLLIAVLAMAAGLVTALGIVSVSMEKRVAEEIKRYGANLVITPQTARMDVGSGGLNFGIVADPVYLDQDAIVRLLVRRTDVVADYSLHLQGVLSCKGVDIPVEGVDFARIRRIFPWWQVRGGWPASEEALIGADLAARLVLRPGESVMLRGAGGELTLKAVGIVTTGGDEDKLLFIEIGLLQRLLGLDRQLTEARLLARSGKVKLEQAAASLQGGIPSGQVREVRQVARTSEALLRKVQFLMLLVTLVVALSAGGSVAGTMSATIIERSGEIGLLKAIGGSRLEVVLLFSAEASFLGVCGGVVGYIMGVGLADSVIRTVFAAPAEFLPRFSLLSVAVSLFLALMGSLGPLLSVFRLDPVASLRGE
jgi:putative ABC transport system permease protein